MLRITITSSKQTVYFRLEGKLVGPWVEELSRAWKALRADRPNVDVVVDLSEVTFVGVEGRSLLASMATAGTAFQAQDVMNCALIEDLRPGPLSMHG